MQARPTFAFGIDLHLTSTDAGGRGTPLLGGAGREHRLNYRPNWGLPGMTPPEQTGAPVLGFARENIAPGESVKAVIVAMFAEEVPLWSAVDEGTELPMYKGNRVCGHARVLWHAVTALPLPDADESRFVEWLSEVG
jgi:hypothetical protein